MLVRSNHLLLLLPLSLLSYVLLFVSVANKSDSSPKSESASTVEKEIVMQQCDFGFEEILRGKAVLQSDNQKLISFIRNRVMLFPRAYKNRNLAELAAYHMDIFGQSPSPSESERVSSNDKIRISATRGQHNQAGLVDEILGGMRNGFFIEAGAWDGRHLSNSMFFEWERNWTGLLIEPNKEAFNTLVTEGYRKGSVAVHGCLAVSNHSAEMILHPANVYGGLESNALLPEKMNVRMQKQSFNRKLDAYPVICYPLYSLLLALDNPVVDFFSLDVEGAELMVLKTIPFQKVKIRLILVEVVYSDERALINFMESVGYKVLKRLELDLVFVPK